MKRLTVFLFVLFLIGGLFLVGSNVIQAQAGFSNSDLSGTYVFHYSGADGSLLNFTVPSLDQSNPFNFSCCGPIPPPSLSANVVQIPFSLPVITPTGGAGSFVADGSGNITSGAGFNFHESVHFVGPPMNINIIGAEGDGSVATYFISPFQNGQFSLSQLKVGMVITVSGLFTPGFDGTFTITGVSEPTATTSAFLTVNNTTLGNEIPSPLGRAVSTGYLIRNQSCNFTLTGTYTVNSDGTGTMNLFPTGPCITLPPPPNGGITFNLLLARKGHGGVFHTTPMPSQPAGITYSSFFTGSFDKQ
jgi:hypothetical protein